MRDVHKAAKEKECCVHPKKFYFQIVDKGIDYVGKYVKPHRVYISNRTRAKAIQKIYGRNQWSNKTKKEIIKVQQSINSYLGTMRGCASYNIRVYLCKIISPEWYKYLSIVNNYKKLKISEYE